MSYELGVISALTTEVEKLRAERDAALSANVIFKKREAENMEREFVMEQQRDAARARVDALMQEYCPGEMTPEQRAEWAAHQQPVTPNVQAAIDAALREDKP